MSENQPNLELRRGDILGARDLEAVVNPVNCFGTMGAGLAQQFARRYPQIVDPYRKVCQRKRLTTDQPQILQVSDDALPRYVVNLATKVHWKRPSRIEWIETGLQAMYRQLDDLEVGSVGLPALGAGLGGLPFGEVRQVIENHAGQYPEILTVLYLPESSRRSTRRSPRSRY